MGDVVDFCQAFPTRSSSYNRLDLPLKLNCDNFPSTSVPTTPGYEPVLNCDQSVRRNRKSSFSRLSTEASSSPPMRLTDAEYFEQSTDFIVREFLANRLRRAGHVDACLFATGSVAAKRTTPLSGPIAREPGKTLKNGESVTGAEKLISSGNDHFDKNGYLSSRKSPALPARSDSFWKRFTSTPVSSCTLRNGKTLEKVTAALIDLGDQFDFRYWQSFQQLLPTNWLDMDNIGDVKDKFFTVSRDLYFSVSSGNKMDGMSDKQTPIQSEKMIKWGRIVAHCCFASHLAFAAVSANHEELITALASWLTQFITRYLRNWIERNGGWEGLVEYRDTLILQKTWGDYASNFAAGVGAGLILGAFGLIIARKYLPIRF